MDTGQGKELSVNIAVPPLPELLLHKFHLCAIRRNQRKDTLEKSTEWIFQMYFSRSSGDSSKSDSCEMMCSIENLVERRCG